MFFNINRNTEAVDAGGATTEELKTTVVDAEPSPSKDNDSFVEEKTGGRFKKWEEIEARLTDYEVKSKELDKLKPEIESFNKYPELQKIKTLAESGADFSTFIKASSINLENPDKLAVLKEGLLVAGELPEVVSHKIKGYEKILSDSKLQAMKEKLEMGTMDQESYDEFMEKRELAEASLNADVAISKKSLAEYKEKYSLDFIDKKTQEQKQQQQQTAEKQKTEWVELATNVSKELNIIGSDIDVGNGSKFEYSLTDNQLTNLKEQLSAAHNLGVPKEHIKEYATNMFMASNWREVVKTAIDRGRTVEAERAAKILSGNVPAASTKSQNTSVKADGEKELTAKEKLDRQKSKYF